jgi:hypothetical protein
MPLRMDRSPRCRRPVELVDIPILLFQPMLTDAKVVMVLFSDNDAMG